jgi:hypothetical protein
MSKFKKVVKAMMSGDIDSAADAFVDRLFKQVLGNDMKLDEILKEAMSDITREHRLALGGLGSDDLVKLNHMFDRHSDRDGNLEVEVLQQALGKFTMTKYPADEQYLHDVWGEIQDELDMREDEIHDMGDQYDQRDYDAEDEAAAFNDRYQQFKNEY